METATEKKIKQKIEKWVLQHSTILVHYPNWYVGVTNAPEARKRQHESAAKKKLFFWNHYYAGSRRIAFAIETFFHKKGMLESDFKGGTREDSKYVYVFKKYPTILD